MRWRDLDLEKGWWTIPGQFAKNGRVHRVPLVEDAIAIIKEQQGRDEKSKNGANKGNEPDEDFVFVGSGVSIRDRAKKAPSKIARVLKIDFRGHDLRRTAATKMAEAGVARHHISAVLNHVDAGAAVTRVYDRYSYDAEKRKALETWAQTLKSITADSQPAKVLSFEATA